MSSMKQLTILILTSALSFATFAQTTSWTAKRITTPQSQNESNTWINFRKDIKLESVPAKAIAKIATDSKYWLWINGEIVVY
jgi:hypothetical protein